MFKDIEDLIYEYDCKDAVIIDFFASTTADGLLRTYDEFTLFGLQNKNGNIVDYAIDNYHTGLNRGCFGVREVYIIPDLSYWNCRKRFYKNISVEYSERHPVQIVKNGGKRK